MRLLFVFLFLISTQSLYAKETMRIGHMLYTSLEASPKDIKTTVSLWMKELGAHTDLDIQSHFYTSLQSMKHDLEAGKINYILIKSLDLIKNFEMDDLLEGYAPARYNDSIHNTLLVIVRKDGKIKNLAEFRGKKIGICTKMDADSLFVNMLLAQDKLGSSDDFFGSIKRRNKRSFIVHDLFFNKVDLGVVSMGTLNLAIEMNPQIGQSIEILAQKQLKTGVVGFFGKHADPALMEKFNSSVKDMHKKKRAQQILTLFKADYLKRSNKYELSELKAYYDTYKQYIQDKDKK